jgi:hypothetical protein
VSRCVICADPMEARAHMCAKCRRSYDRTAHRDGSVMEAMAWAARRARRVERARMRGGAK